MQMGSKVSSSSCQVTKHRGSFCIAQAREDVLARPGPVLCSCSILIRQAAAPLGPFSLLPADAGGSLQDERRGTKSSTANRWRNGLEVEVSASGPYPPRRGGTGVVLTGHCQATHLSMLGHASEPRYCDTHSLSWACWDPHTTAVWGDHAEALVGTLSTSQLHPLRLAGRVIATGMASSVLFSQDGQ